MIRWIHQRSTLQQSPKPWQCRAVRSRMTSPGLHDSASVRRVALRSAVLSDDSCASRRSQVTADCRVASATERQGLTDREHNCRDCEQVAQLRSCHRSGTEMRRELCQRHRLIRDRHSANPSLRARRLPSTAAGPSKRPRSLRRSAVGSVDRIVPRVASLRPAASPRRCGSPSRRTPRQPHRAGRRVEPAPARGTTRCCSRRRSPWPG